MGVCASKADLKRLEENLEKMVEAAEENDSAQIKSFKKLMEDLGNLQEEVGLMDNMMSKKLNVFASKEDLEQIDSAQSKNFKNLSSEIQNLHSEVGTMDDMISQKLIVCASKSDLKKLEESLQSMMEATEGNDAAQMKSLKKLADDLHNIQSELGSMDEAISLKLDVCASKAEFKKLEENLEENDSAQHKNFKKLTEEIHNLQTEVGSMDENISHKLSVCASREDFKRIEENLGSMGEHISHKLAACASKEEFKRLEENLAENDTSQHKSFKKLTEDIHSLQAEVGSMDENISHKLAVCASKEDVKRLEESFAENDASQHKSFKKLTEDIHNLQEDVGSIDEMISHKVASKADLKKAEETLENMMQATEENEAKIFKKLTDEFHNLQSEVVTMDEMISHKLNVCASKTDLKKLESNIEMLKETTEENDAKNFKKMADQVHHLQLEIESRDEVITQKLDVCASKSDLKKMDDSISHKIVEASEAQSAKIVDSQKKRFQTLAQDLGALQQAVGSNIVDRIQSIMQKREAESKNEFIMKLQNEVETIEEALSCKLAASNEQMISGVTSKIVESNQTQRELIDQDLKKLQAEFVSMQEMMKEMISNDMIAAMQKMMEGVSSKIVEASEGAMQILEEHIQVMIDKKDEDDLAHKQRFETMTKELRALQSEVAADLKASTASIEMTLGKGSEALKTNELIMESHMKQMQEQTEVALNIVRQEIMMKRNEITRHKKVIKTQSEKMHNITAIFNHVAPKVAEVIHEAHGASLDVHDDNDVVGISNADDAITLSGTNDMLAIEGNTV